MITKVSVILILVTIFFSSCVFFKNKDEGKIKIASGLDSGNAEMSFEKKLYDFGEVKQGEVVGCYFVFQNIGNKPLIISNVEAGCGCAEVKYPKKPIKEGGKGEIEVRFDSYGFLGHQYKVIRVDANVLQKSKELVVSANVIN